VLVVVLAIEIRVSVVVLVAGAVVVRVAGAVVVPGEVLAEVDVQFFVGVLAGVLLGALVVLVAEAVPGVDQGENASETCQVILEQLV